MNNKKNNIWILFFTLAAFMFFSITKSSNIEENLNHKIIPSNQDPINHQ